MKVPLTDVEKEIYGRDVDWMHEENQTCACTTRGDMPSHLLRSDEQIYLCSGRSNVWTNNHPALICVLENDCWQVARAPENADCYRSSVKLLGYGSTISCRDVLPHLPVPLFSTVENHTRRCCTHDLHDVTR